MPAPTTKAQWIEKLRDEGIAVPTEWNLIQIKAHWAEVQEERRHSLDKRLEEKLSDLKRASRKKGDLIAFLEKEGAKFSPTATISQLFKVGEEGIYKSFPPSGNEKVGFGKHGDLTFQEVLKMHPQYVNWVQTTAAEEEKPYWRLERLAKWSEQQTGKPGRRGSGATSSTPTFDMTKGGYKKEAPMTLTQGDLDEWHEFQVTELESKIGKPPPSKNSKPRPSSLEEENQALRTKIMELEAAQADLELQTGRMKGRKEM